MINGQVWITKITPYYGRVIRHLPESDNPPFNKAMCGVVGEFVESSDPNDKQCSFCLLRLGKEIPPERYIETFDSE